MQPSNTLRIDPEDGSPAIEYRIAEDVVESRLISEDAGQQWRVLTAQQLTEHAMRGTALAYWLRRRMGIQWLIRACNHEVMAA
jgi:hypothetical protein